MKTLTLLLLLALLSVTNGQSEYQTQLCPYELIEQNYIQGLKSDNCGLRVSCAYFLGEMKSTKAVIPLMDLLNTCARDEVRLIAALSLIKIGDERGIFLVKRQAEFCDNERVRQLCERIYNSYILQKYSDVSEYAKEGDEELQITISSFEKNTGNPRE